MIEQNFEIVKENVRSSNQKYLIDGDNADTQIIAVSKTKPAEDIEELLLYGHRIFGENRVQEALAKWPELKEKYAGVSLHLFGALQTNKVRDALKIFDVIEVLDREKLARAFKKELADSDESPEFFIQVNIGEEEQKAGILPDQADDFIKLCKGELGLNVVGLMCIPPADEPAAPHFALLKKIATRNDLQKLSMGMSGDYELAAAMGASFVRVGTAIFGERNMS